MILDMLGPQPGRVLDIACGFGLVSKPLVARGVEVTGVDYNWIACQGADRNGLHALRGNAFGLPFSDSTFDTIICIEFLQQCEKSNVAALMTEVARVVKPGGRVLFVWRNHEAPLHRLVLYASDRLGRPRVPLNEHRFEDIAEMATREGLIVDLGGKIFPPLRQIYTDHNTLMAALLGTGFLAVLRKPHGSP